MKTALDNFFAVFSQHIVDVELQILNAESVEEKEMLTESLDELLKTQLKLEQLMQHRELEHIAP